MNRTHNPISYFIITVLFLWCLSAVPAAAGDLTAKQKVAFIQPIENLAMQFGEGSTKVYVFVDPKCPHSQDFISMIIESRKMRGMYHYYIFFYELKRLNSHDLIRTIYGSFKPLQLMLEVMVGKKEIDTVPAFEPKIEEKINTIAGVAEELGISKRPYLIIAKEKD